jgi:hypothetical protein
MIKSVQILFVLFFYNTSFAQKADNVGLIKLWQCYNLYNHTKYDPPKQVTDSLLNNIPKDFTPTANFIIQAITKGTMLSKQRYLAVADSLTLKNLYIILSLHDRNNSQDATVVDDAKLNYIIDSLRTANIPKNELVLSYYSMFFSGWYWKTKGFNYPKLNFNLNHLNLINDTEKGIFFLQFMIYCSQQIFSYMNIEKQANTKKAYLLIKSFPKFNGLEYYQFKDFGFSDFEMGTSNISFKDVYIKRFYGLLLMHLECMEKQNKRKRDIRELLSSSILSDKNYDRYSKQSSLKP